MIVDTFERGASYELGPLWKRIFPELLVLVSRGDSIEEGTHRLAGGLENGGADAIVGCRALKEYDDAFYENHFQMADIQAVLSGEEFLYVFPLSGEETERSSSVGRDIVFYEDKPEHAQRILLRPGMFALILPGEAHLPDIKADVATVKKLVVKLPAAALPISQH